MHTMYMYGIITVPLWITYIPAIILAPLIMNKLDNISGFHDIQILKLIIFSILIGAFLGVLVLTPVLFLVFNESTALFLGWVFAGMVSGCITSIILSLLYRTLNRNLPDQATA